DGLVQRPAALHMVGRSVGSRVPAGGPNALQERLALEPRNAHWARHQVTDHRESVVQARLPHLSYPITGEVRVVHALNRGQQALFRPLPWRRRVLFEGVVTPWEDQKSSVREVRQIGLTSNGCL